MKIINKVFLILLVSLAASCLFAQSDLSFGYRKPQAEIDTFVQKVIGAGTLTATVRAADGGYVTTSKIEDTSFLAMKIKVSGQKQWERRLNFASDDFASINGIAQTTDGGFVLAGEVCLEDQGCGATLVKLRPNGTVAWKKSLAVSGDDNPEFSSVIATHDGGVIAIGTVGFFPTRFVVVRFAATGNVVWGKSFGNFDTYYGRLSFEVTADNGLILAFTVSFGRFNSNNLDVMKITYSGTVVWEKFLTADDFGFQSLGTTADNGLILVGSSSNRLNVVVLKADGTINWKAAYSLKVGSVIISSVSSPVQTPDGGFVLTGTTRSGNGFIAKIDSSRKVAFQNTFGNGLASGESVFRTPDGGFFLFGATPRSRPGAITDILVLKVNSEGIVPGCSFFQSRGTTTRTSFGPLKIGPVTATTLNDLSLEPFNFGLTSVVTNHPASTLCQ